MKEIAEELKELYEYVIEYFIELRCEKYLFETVYGKIVKNLPSFEYWELFIEALKPFILAEKLTRIPSIQVTFYYIAGVQINPIVLQLKKVQHSRGGQYEID